MTIPSYSGLQTALSGLEAAQAAIDTTGQNIANANTPGYSRQSVNMTERDPLTIQSLSNVTGAGSQLGLGVDITSIGRIRDQFLDVQYRGQNTQTSGDNTASTLLGQVQAALAEPGSSGLSSSLAQFWQSWNALGNTPTGQGGAGALQAVIGAGQTVATSLNTLRERAHHASVADHLPVQHADRSELRPDRHRRQPDRRAQHADRPGPGQRSKPQHAARSARPADRQPVAVLQRERHHPVQRDGERQLRECRQGRRRGHDRRDAARQRRHGRSDPQPDRRQPERLRRDRRGAPGPVRLHDGHGSTRRLPDHAEWHHEQPGRRRSTTRSPPPTQAARPPPRSSIPPGRPRRRSP